MDNILFSILLTIVGIFLGFIVSIIINNIKGNKRLGTRHRAALGISESSDCISIIASEETGRLSMAIDGELYYNLTLDEIKLRLLEELRPKKESFVDDKEEKDENNSEVSE